MKCFPVIAVVCVLLPLSPVRTFAAPIAVRQTQGATRGFLTMRSADGKIIAHGDLVQVAHGDHITARLTYRFLDGSIDDDTTVYTQRGTFRLISEHHVQRGPFFPKPVDATVNGPTGAIAIRSLDKQDKNGAPKENDTEKQLPADVYNGMIGTLLVNVPATVAPFTVALLAPSGKGRLVHLAIAPESKTEFAVTGIKHTATIFRIKVQLGGVAGVVAPVIGKQPEDTLVWVLEGEVPAFVRQIGPLYDGGPIVDIQLPGATFPASSAPRP